MKDLSSCLGVASLCDVDVINHLQLDAKKAAP